MLPLSIAFVPFALVIGAAMAEHGDALAGWTGSLLIFAGSAHLASIRTLEQGGVVAAVLTGLLVNLRLAVYSAGLATRWLDQPRWFRLAAAGLVNDPTWAAAERHAAECADATARRHRFVAAGVTLMVVWSAAIGAGVLAGARLDTLDLAVAIPLCLLATVGDALTSPGRRRVVGAAAIVALLTSGYPAGTGLLLATAAGCVAGLLPSGTDR